MYFDAMDTKIKLPRTGGGGWRQERPRCGWHKGAVSHQGLGGLT